MNPLQAGLLERWLGDRDDLCVVGDDYQTIYAFTGASPEHLLGFTRRYPHATVVRLEENYRSTPEVLELANRLATRLGGFRKTLRATRPSGPPPLARAEPDEEAEVGAVVQAVRRPAQGGGGAARGDRGAVPDQRPLRAVRGGLRRRGDPVPGARRRVPAAAGPARGPAAAEALGAGGSVAEAVAAITDQLGYDPEAAPDADEEVTRQSDLGRMRSLAAEFERAHPDGDAAAFGAELARRFSTEHSGRGVNLLTYHRAKGLEFDAVFLPRLLDGELPFRSGRAKADPEEERRLLYVGITRARRYLFLTWPAAGRAQPSPFLDELELAPPVPLEASSRARAGGHGRPRRRAVRPAEGVAPQTRERGRRARLRRVPRPNARRDRRTPVQGLGRPRRDLGRRDRPSSNGTRTRSWRSSPRGRTRRWRSELTW